MGGLSLSMLPGGSNWPNLARQAEIRKECSRTFTVLRNSWRIPCVNVCVLETKDGNGTLV